MSKRRRSGKERRERRGRRGRIVRSREGEGRRRDEEREWRRD